MKIFISLLVVFISFSSNALECKGHIFFVNLAEGLGDVDTDTDFSYYYHEVEKWLPAEGISYSAHTELPLRSTTCFSKEITIPKKLLNYQLGYVFVKPNSEKKYIEGVLTDMDISVMIKEFFE
jgi:hypothetical protein